MKRRGLLWIADLCVLGLVGTLIAQTVWKHRTETPPDSFVQAVDLAPLQRMAVQNRGRIKAWDSYAREVMHVISGRRSVQGQPAIVTYLDLMLRPEAYTDVPTIYVKNKNVRQQIIAGLNKPPSPEWAARFQDQGLISEAMLRRPAVQATLAKLETDVMRTAKDVNRIHSAMALSDPANLMPRLALVPPISGRSSEPWSTLSDLVGSPAPATSAHAGLSNARPIPGLDDARRSTLTEAWSAFAEAWRKRDASAASTAAAAFADGVRELAPQLYPESRKMGLENWYFRNNGMTWVWLLYLVAVIPLLLSVVYRWRRARLLGLGLFCVALGFHTAALIIRWIVADRWPNSNMFEAIHTAAWFGAVAALGLEWWVRKTPMRNLFALGAAVCAMAALMAGRYTVAITPDIDNFMPILDDIWLYIHTNMIIWSYALIGMAAITGLLYLRYRFGGGEPTVAKAGGAGTLILSGAPGGQPLQDEPTRLGQVLDGATMILMELSFVMLWAGIVMGAVWADHSWGRPWGWDPKEVFALNTFLIFLLLVHVRYKVRDKGLWTALLAVVGCGVMLFNWIVINFQISGLHSYA